MKNAKKPATSKPKNASPIPFDSLVAQINNGIESRRSDSELDYIQQIHELVAAYERVESGLHPEVVVHALANRCVSLYQQLTSNKDKDYCLILLSTLAHSVSVCVTMYHNEEFYGDVVGGSAREKDI